MIPTINPYDPNEVYNFKLVTGEEIISKITVANSSTITLDRPRVITPIRTQQGISLTVIPFLKGSADDQPIRIYINQLVNEPVVATKENADAYRSEVSGLDLSSTLLG